MTFFNLCSNDVGFQDWPLILRGAVGLEKNHFKFDKYLRGVCACEGFLSLSFCPAGEAHRAHLSLELGDNPEACQHNSTVFSRRLYHVQ